MDVPEPLDIGVVIVSWNTHSDTLAAVESVRADLAGSGLRWRIIVVDNASSDGTVDALRAACPDVEVIESGENLGFVRANNLGMRRLGLGDDGDHPRAVYLLNPDTVTPPGATRALFDALFSDEQTGMVGPGLCYGDGSFQHSAFMFPGLHQLWMELFPVPARLYETTLNGRYPRALYAAGIPFEVDFVLGAAMMARAETVRRVGMLDEVFFMYCEEIDWAWRMRRAGWRTLCVPAALVTHLGGQASSQVRPQTIVRLWTSRMTLFARYYPPWKRRAARVMIGIGMRRLAARHADAPEVAAACREVAALAGKLLA
jgi:N-acetylglucosaminyl-diphospho-decaprenol L-rhamnosyltransferase